MTAPEQLPQDPTWRALSLAAIALMFESRECAVHGAEPAPGSPTLLGMPSCIGCRQVVRRARAREAIRAVLVPNPPVGCRRG